VLTTASWVEPLHRMLGIAGVSPVWDDAPAWYFWIAGAPGPYCLSLEQAWADDSRGAGALHGLFSIKCFPLKTSEELSTFSFVERHLIENGSFDTTNTPRFEARSTIPPSLFVVGVFEWTIDRDDLWSVLTLESSDLMLARYEAEVLEDYPLTDLSRLCFPGEIARSVRGWDLSYRLFDRFVSLWAYHLKARPARVIHARSPGIEYICRSAEAWECVETDRTSVQTFHVLFAESGAGEDRIEALARDLKGAAVTVVNDLAGGCSCPAHRGHEAGEAPHVNHRWWEMADLDLKSDLTSPCGCS